MKIPKDIVEKIFEQGEKEAPVEACGYLAGTDGCAKRRFPMRNKDMSPEHFTLDPQEQFAVIRQARKEGLEVFAVYHTHPATPARPSAEDIRLAHDPSSIYVIASLVPGSRNIRAFRIVKGEVSEEELVIE